MKILSILLFSAVVHSSESKALETCPQLFQDAAHLIARSPYLLSSDPSINRACHQCISGVAVNMQSSILCRLPGMPHYDANYPIEKNCHCLTLGLTDQCADLCLPNVLCQAQDSPSSVCTACVEKQSNKACNATTPWSFSCYETCASPACIAECSPPAHCHPQDRICQECVSANEPKCNRALKSQDRHWSYQCTSMCFHDTCFKECNRHCGDNFKTRDEECDDGNAIDGDGCDKNCRIEPNFICDLSASSSSICHYPICGDGKRQLNEECDDGNLANGDGCSASCLIERGFTCTNNECRTTCGDGIKAGEEECDDGNVQNSDGCSRECRIENGYQCDNTPNIKSVCFGKCGDGIVIASEICDDGNVKDNDGCSSHCHVEKGYECQVINSTSLCTGKCGDGILQANEQCDDRNAVSNDGCSATCQIENGWHCLQSPSVCQRDQICGNGVVQFPQEECDDQNLVNGDGCSSNCTIEKGFTCMNDRLTLLSSCTQVVAVCGDGKIELNEQCDDGNTVDEDGCNHLCQIESNYQCESTPSRCTLIQECGNGVIEKGETCDDGNTDNGDGCSSVCTIEAGFTCKVEGKCSPICGDGLKTKSEECDDQNLVNGDGCSSSCLIEPGFECTTNAKNTSSCLSICGDGIQTLDEDCDDRNIVNGDGCSSTCKVEEGYSCPRNQACVIACGDGYVFPQREACDDGNRLNGDGCSSTCDLELDYLCSSTPLPTSQSTCTRVPRCGNGLVEANEDCDDGNTNSNDGCSSRCRLENHFQCSTPNAPCTPLSCPNVRYDWKDLSDQAKANVFSCLNKAFERDLYQKMVGIHVYTVNDLYAHYTNGFVAWHRKWLLALEYLLRSFGGECTCLTLPYWDWGEEASMMQMSGCRTKEECSPTMREWGGGGNVSDVYRVVDVWNTVNGSTPADSAMGYCVNNEITSKWRSNSELGSRYNLEMNASCPIIRRGWNDWRDVSNGVEYASPMVATSFLAIASSIRQAQTYAQFAPFLNGDVHILPHDNSGGFLLTFMSPADPLFILHHTNVDRLWAIWEHCRGCTTAVTQNPQLRFQNSFCYNQANTRDGITTPMPFWYFGKDAQGNEQRVYVDEAEEFAEFWPRGFNTPGDLIGISTFGAYAYSYAADDLDQQLLQTGGCPAATPNPQTGVVLLEESAEIGTTEERKAMLEYLAWLENLLKATTEFFNAFQMNWFSSSTQATHASVVDIAATCECMHLMLTVDEKLHGQHQIFQDISARTRRVWQKKSEHPSCYHRLIDETTDRVLQRHYCEVIFLYGKDSAFQEGAMASLMAWLEKSQAWFTSK